MNDQALILKEIEKILVEQSFGGYPMSQGDAMNWEADQYKKAHQPAKDVVEPIVKGIIDFVYENRHILLDIAEIGSLWIPYAGPYISAGIGLYHAKLYYDEGDTKMAGLYVMFAAFPLGGPIAKGIYKGSKYISLLFKGGIKSKSVYRVGDALVTGNTKTLTKTELGAAREFIQLGKKNPNIIKNLQKEAFEKSFTKETIKQIEKKSPTFKDFLYKGGNYFWNGTKWVVKKAISAAPAVAAIGAYDEVSDIVLGPKAIVVADQEYVSQFGDPHSKKAKDEAWKQAKIYFMSNGEGPDNIKLKNAWLDPEPYGTQESKDLFSFLSTNRIKKDEKLEASNKEYKEQGGWRPGLAPPYKYWTSSYKKAITYQNENSKLATPNSVTGTGDVLNSLGL